MDWKSLGRFHISIGTELILFIFLPHPQLWVCLSIYSCWIHQEPFSRECQFLLVEHFLYAPSHLILTIPHYIGTIIPLNSQMRKLRLKKLGNMAKVSALLRGGTWAQTQQADSGAPACRLPCSPARGHQGDTEMWRAVHHPISRGCTTHQ